MRDGRRPRSGEGRAMSETCFICHKLLEDERIVHVNNAHAHLVLCDSCSLKTEGKDLIPMLDSVTQTKDATIAALRAQLADMQSDIDLLTAMKRGMAEDVKVGRAIREYFSQIEGRYLTSAKMEISVHRYDLEERPEAHWNIDARVEGKERDIEDILTGARDMPDNPTLPDALRAAGLLDKEAADE